MSLRLTYWFFAHAELRAGPRAHAVTPKGTHRILALGDRVGARAGTARKEKTRTHG